METEAEALQIFRDSGALLEGHFILRSGLRSRQFFQCAQVCQYLDKVTRLAELLLKKIDLSTVKTVLAPAMGGLVIGQEVARQAGKRYIFVEKVEDRLALRRNFRIEKGEGVLVVEDVVTRGGRVKEAIEIIRACGGHVPTVAVLVDRSGGEVDFGVPMVALAQMNIPTYEPTELPADLRKITPVKPGS